MEGRGEREAPWRGDEPASMSATTTFAPSLAKRRAHSAPMPWPDPVMIATWPASMPFGQLRWPAICWARSAIAYVCMPAELRVTLVDRYR